MDVSIPVRESPDGSMMGCTATSVLALDYAPKSNTAPNIMWGNLSLATSEATWAGWPKQVAILAAYDTEKTQVTREIFFLSELRNEFYTPKLLDYWFCPALDTYYIVEDAPGMSLVDYVNAQKTTPKLPVGILEQMRNVAMSIGQMGIVHNNARVENWFIDPHTLTVTLLDWGEAIEYREHLARDVRDRSRQVRPPGHNFTAIGDPEFALYATLVQLEVSLQRQSGWVTLPGHPWTGFDGIPPRVRSHFSVLRMTDYPPWHMHTPHSFDLGPAIYSLAPGHYAVTPDIDLGRAFYSGRVVFKTVDIVDLGTDPIDLRPGGEQGRTAVLVLAGEVEFAINAATDVAAKGYIFEIPPGGASRYFTFTARANRANGARIAVFRARL